MTINTITTALNYPDPQAIRLQYKRLGLGEPPRPSAVLDPAKVVTLLSQMSVKNTRRTQEQADAAAQLLAEFQAGKHQNGHLSEQSAVVVQNITRNDLPKPKKTERKKRGASQPVVIPQQAPTNGKSHSGGWFQMVVSFVGRAIEQTTMLDVVYLATISTAVYGLHFTLKEMGLAFAVPYCLISWHALQMAKDPAKKKTAQAGVAAVVVLEVLTFFIHLVLFNLRLVQAAKDSTLPFSYWESYQVPFYIACILSGLFSGAGIYAVSVTFSLTREKYNAEQKAIAEAKEQAERIEQQSRARAEYLEQLRNRNV